MTGTAGDRLTRLLSLVPWLVAHDQVTIAECASHFGVTVDQLETDLWLLIVCGVPGYGPDQLVDIDFWTAGRIHVIDPQTLGRPLRLTHMEALSLLMALRMLAQLPGVEDREAVASAAAKLERATSEAGSDRYIAIEVIVPAAVTREVDAALADHRELHIRYASGGADEVTERTIQPIRLFAIDGISYLEAYCLSASARRTFRLDRMLAARIGAEVTDPAGEHEPAGTPLPELPRGDTVVVLLLAPQARWIIDVHPVTEVGVPGTDGRTSVHLPIHSVAWGARLVLSLRGAATALEPPELVRAVAEASEQALAAYSSGVG